jgi:cellulose synthase/poly-beta-1,6-N-acetylglucosamine synthase-like glycosyltransferase
VRWFALEEVGGVCGRRVTHGDVATPAAGGDRLYWGFSSFLKERESELASAVGADGALYALRRTAFRPQSGCADDLSLSLGVVEQGLRLAYDREAVALESSAPRLRHEFRRKLRTQACALPVLLPLSVRIVRTNPLLAWMLLSHKLMRYLVPPAQFACLVLSARGRGRLLRAAFAIQLAGYGLAAASALLVLSGRASSRAAVPCYALVGQLAIALAPLQALAGLQASWKPTPPGTRPAAIFRMTPGRSERPARFEAGS